MNLIFRVESHSGGTSEIRTANAGMNGRTLLESGGAFSKHFPHGTKTGAHFFGAKIARSSRGVKRGLGTGNPDVSPTSRDRRDFGEAPQRQRAQGDWAVHWDALSVFK